MSLTVIYREGAQAGLRRLRAADKAAFGSARAVCRALADEPYPGGAVPWGQSGYYRLHAGDLRILYEVNEEKSAVYIVRVDQVT